MDKAKTIKAVEPYKPMERTECRFCNGETVLLWRNLNFWRCNCCRLIFKHPMPDEKSLTDLYVKSWTSPYENRSQTGGTSLELARIYARKLAESLCLEDFSGLKILDFGAGRGDALRALTELGANMYGVEPFGYDNLKNQGFQVFSTLDEIPEDLTFDGIYTRDVIEHLRSPWVEIQKFNDLLVENGFIFLATPNAESLRAKLQGEKWKEAVRPGHIVLFTERSMEAILDRSGYTTRKRLKLFVQYSENPLRSILQYTLKTFRVDGELHYLVRKS